MTMSEGPQHGAALLRVEALWKVFGPEPHRIVENREFKDASKDEIQKRTGAVLGLRNISFHVDKGEFFVLMGLSGSGKSTLIRCMLRLIEPTAGQIKVEGEDICRYDPKQLIHFRRKLTAMVFQHFGLLPHYTVIDNVAYGLKVSGIDKEKQYESARKAIETVGLKGWENYLPEALSGGMQQRVGLARALATDPEILLMDEPFSGLDPLIRREMQDELVELQDKLQKTIIFVTHDLHEALKLGDRIAIMRDGVIIQVGSPDEIITSPADAYVQDFVQDASPAKVLSAGQIMKEPELLLYDWQSVKVARTLLGRSSGDQAFVLTKNRRLCGLADLETLEALPAGQDAPTLKKVLIVDHPTCTPETLVEELFPLASDSRYPIAVVLEDGRFLGEIRSRTILKSMIRAAEAD